MLEKLKKYFSFISVAQIPKLCLLSLNIYTLIIICSLYFYLDNYLIINNYSFLDIKLNVEFLLIGCIMFNLIILFYSNIKWLKIFNIINLSWADVLKSLYFGSEDIHSRLATYRRIRTVQEKYQKLLEWLKEDNIEFSQYLKDKLVNECLNFSDLYQQYVIEKEIYLTNLLTGTDTSNSFSFYNILTCIGAGLIFLLITYNNNIISATELGSLETRTAYLEFQNTIILRRLNTAASLFLLTPAQIKKLVDFVFLLDYSNISVGNLPKKFIPFSGKGNVLGRYE